MFHNIFARNDKQKVLMAKPVGGESGELTVYIEVMKILLNLVAENADNPEIFLVSVD